MVSIVTDEKQITKYQKAFIQKLRSICLQKIEIIVGYQGFSEPVTAFYSSKYNFWYSSQKSTNKYWNAFGIGIPNANSSNSITVEINPPFSGINRNIGGVFGQTNKGEILVLHRGKIGGGRKGIGKQLFIDQHRGDDFITVDDNGVENKLFLIGAISSKFFPRQLSNFISSVGRIKITSTKDLPDFSKLNNFKFSYEPFGTNEVKRKGISTIERIHGIVVNSLADQLEKKGLTIGKDSNRDLFIYHRQKIVTLFEIKTDSSSQSLYSAVGQLLIYSIPITTKLKMVMVIPDKLTDAVTNRLTKLGIEILYYSWEKDEPAFRELNNFI